MFRRTFRFSLRVGVVAALVLAAMKLLRAREAAAPAGEGWADNDRNWRPPPAPRPPARATAPGPPRAPTAATPPAADTAAPTQEAPAAPPAEPTAAGDTTTASPTKASAAKAPAKRAPTRQEPAPAAPAPDAVAHIWVAPVGATCPPDHPVKVKLASRLFHVPGMFAYDRTRPDRCYADEHQAAAEGFSRAKR